MEAQAAGRIHPSKVCVAAATVVNISGTAESRAHLSGSYLRRHSAFA